MSPRPFELLYRAESDRLSDSRVSRHVMRITRNLGVVPQYEANKLAPFEALKSQKKEAPSHRFLLSRLLLAIQSKETLHII